MTKEELFTEFSDHPTAEVGIEAPYTVGEEEPKQRYEMDEPTDSLQKSSKGDPFELRDGKTLSWRNINMRVTAGKKGAEDKAILRDVWGEVPPRETTAILGPSGAGKTSLLNILCGRTTSGGRVKINSDVRLNNATVDPTNINVRKQIAFVAQDDSLMISSTPRESIRFSAKLRLPKETTEHELNDLTATMLRELGLANCADTIVGGELLKGISGGERKRTSVGVELVTKPSMVFLDEPTSGLDSFSAVQLCQVLKKVANAGASVLFTIHQPSSDIFESFDRLILMNKGRIMFQGPIGSVEDYFEARQHPLPPRYNPADWVMIVAQSVSEEELEAQGFFEKDPRPEIEPHEGSFVKRKGGTHVGFGVQLGLLFKRDIVSIRRDKMILGARIMMTTFMSVLTGIIFWQVGASNSSDPSNLQSHFGAEMVVMIAAMLGTALPALVVFPQERPVFVREYSTNHYSILPYFFSRLAMEAFLTGIQMLILSILTYFMVGFQLSFGWHLLIVYALAMASNAIAVLLGSGVQDPKLAIEFLPMCFIPQFLFAGFFVRPELIPVWLRWLMWCFPMTYAVRLHMEQEFGNCEPEVAKINCEALLRNVDVNTDATWWYWLVLLLLFAFFRLAALVALRRKATKFY